MQDKIVIDTHEITQAIFFKADETSERRRLFARTVKAMDDVALLLLSNE